MSKIKFGNQRTKRHKGIISYPKRQDIVGTSDLQNSGDYL
jgi:hypothetical protein